MSNDLNDLILCSVLLKNESVMRVRPRGESSHIACLSVKCLQFAASVIVLRICMATGTVVPDERCSGGGDAQSTRSNWRSDTESWFGMVQDLWMEDEERRRDGRSSLGSFSPTTHRIGIHHGTSSCQCGCGLCRLWCSGGCPYDDGNRVLVPFYNGHSAIGP